MSSRISAASIRPRDLVLIAGATPFHAEVVATSRDGLPRGRLEVRGICAGRNRPREVLVRDVEAHWRKAAVRAPEAAR
jgi:hypothetical protein